MTSECLFDTASACSQVDECSQVPKYKMITNDLAIQRILVGQWTERPMGERKVVGSRPVKGRVGFVCKYC